MNWLRNLFHLPQPLPLGAPFLTALFRRQKVSGFPRLCFGASVIGCLMALALVAVDYGLFSGRGVARVRLLAAEPVWARVVLVVYSGVMEEIAFRFGLMTVVAWVTAKLLSRFHTTGTDFAIWVGLLISALLFGLGHVRPATAAASVEAIDVIRAVVVNSPAGIILGVLYWKKGLEAAMIAHTAADAVIYLGLASLL
jgi:membrane protease YdiL (CAAX protease family)